MSCARLTVPEGVALVSCENMQVGSDVHEDGSAGSTEPAGGGQIRPADVIFAKEKMDQCAKMDQLEQLNQLVRKGGSAGEKIKFTAGLVYHLDGSWISNGDVQIDVKRNLESAMMTSAFLLEEVVIRNYDVSFISRQQAVISNYDVSNISRQLDGSAMMTLAKLLKMKQQVTVDEAVEESETDEVIEQKLLADTITEAVGHTITVPDDSNH
ncbi:hypothetical protein F511_09821 [Dorcoceras hygrometricum]|uniref:Uncharacterized protein n=1 Tax=Dorcoceras hygrometricum TaxID=472368 RepID=A0A2Z7AKQ4_9LAMI|nr:hypothetical protein F511_09821 [Dorcoceras hygrometricum]